MSRNGKTLNWSSVKKCLRNWGLRFSQHRDGSVTIFPYDNDSRFAYNVDNPREAFSIGEAMARQYARGLNYFNSRVERRYA